MGKRRGGIFMKKILIVTAAIIAVIVLIAAAALIRLNIRTSKLADDYSCVYDDPKYQEPVYVEGVDVITQDVSCGYAVIEMFSAWNGERITEEELYDEYGRVATSTDSAFCDEMNLRFPEYTTQMYTYQTNTEMIDRIYDSLASGVPVPFEWAALYEDEWTLHYSLIIGLDIPADTVTVANPYGYIEQISLDEFIGRTTFEAYENMPLFLKLGFAFGLFDKNTVFIVD